MELHVIITGRAPDLVARVVAGRLIIVPAAAGNTAAVQDQPQTTSTTR